MPLVAPIVTIDTDTARIPIRDNVGNEGLKRSEMPQTRNRTADVGSIRTQPGNTEVTVGASIAQAPVAKNANTIRPIAQAVTNFCPAVSICVFSAVTLTKHYY